MRAVDLVSHLHVAPVQLSAMVPGFLYHTVESKNGVTSLDAATCPRDAEPKASWRPPKESSDWREQASFS